MDPLSALRRNISQSINTKTRLLDDEKMLSRICLVVTRIINCYRQGYKVLICGNGGSAADAQHIAAELSGRYYHDRPPLYAEALHVNTSYLTAVSNDYSFDEVFARLIKAKGQKGDVLIGLSTSGKSTNVINALRQAQMQNMYTVGFSGADGGEMNDYCDVLIGIPSTDTPRIQECHLLVGHAICEIVEQALFVG